MTRIAIVASPGPWDEPGFADLPLPQIRSVREKFASEKEQAEKEYRAELEAQRQAMLRHPEEAFGKFVANLSEPDQRLFEDPSRR